MLVPLLAYVLDEACIAAETRPVDWEADEAEKFDRLTLRDGAPVVVLLGRPQQGLKRLRFAACGQTFF